MSGICSARIWPAWAPGWMQCCSPVGNDGRCATYGHQAGQGELRPAGPAQRGTVPAIRPDRVDVDGWLYERAEEACAAGLPLERALQAVRDGYSSRVADYVIAQDLDQWPDGLIDLSQVQR